MTAELELERLYPIDGWARDFYVGDDEAIRKFAHDNDDHNPLHHDSEVARRAGMLGIIAPGLMVLKFVNTSISDKLSEVMFCDLHMRMKTPVYAGSHLSVSCSVLRQGNRLTKLAVAVKNGFVVVAEGSCLLLLPKPSVSTMV